MLKNLRLTIICLLIFSLPLIASFADVSWQEKGPIGASVRVEKIIVSEADPSVLYCFAYNASDNVYDIYVSYTSGESWQRQLEPHAPIYTGTYTYDLKIDPQNGNRFWLTGRQMRNETWKHGVFQNNAYLIGDWTDKYVPNNWISGAVAIYGADPRIVYASTSPTGGSFGAAPALLMTTNEGDSFEIKIYSLSPDGVSVGIDSIAISPADPAKILFSAHSLSIPSGGDAIYLSTNEGVSYSRRISLEVVSINDPLIGSIKIRKGAYATGEVNAYAFGWRFHNKMYRSTDEGYSWTVIQYPDYGFTGSVAVSDSDFDTIYLVSDYTIYKSENAGTSWTEKTAGITASQVYCVAVDPNNSDIACVGTNMGVYKTTDGGDSWTAVNTGLGSGVIGDLALSKMAPSDIYISLNSYPYNTRKSTDFAETWSDPITTIRRAHFITIDQLTSTQLYCTLARRNAYRSTDAGLNWTELANLPRITAEVTSGIAVSEIDRALYIEIYKRSNHGDVLSGRLLTSTDSGESFSEQATFTTEEVASIIVCDPISAEVLFRGRNLGDNWAVMKSSDFGASFSDKSETGMAYVNDICVDPSDNSKVFVACGTPEGCGGLWKSTDYGENYTSISLPTTGYVKQVRVCPSMPNVIYMSILTDNYTGAGVWKSNNGGTSWTRVSGSVLEDSSPVYLLMVDPTSHPLIYAGTDNGVYKGLVDAPVPSPEAIFPISGNRFYPVSAVITGNYFFDVDRVYLKSGGTEYDLSVSSYTPVSIEAVIPVSPLKEPGTYEVVVEASPYGSTLTSVNNPTFEVLEGDVDGPIFSMVKFDGRFHYPGCPVSRTPRITCVATDEDYVSPESFSILLHNTSDQSFRDINAPQPVSTSSEIDIEYTIGSNEPPMPSGNYDMYFSAQDLSPGENVGTRVLQVRVYGGDPQVIGDVLCYPVPFKPLSGENVRIAYNLSQDADVTIYVYDVSGRVVLTRKYSSGAMGGHAGYNEFSWDGESDFGNFIGNGIYVCKITAGNSAIGTVKIPVID